MDRRIFRYLAHFIFLCISGKIIRDIREVKKRINLAKTGSPAKKENSPKIQPLVSIVIPTKNEAGFIEKLLESIKNQSYKNIEVIVVDYKSDDGTVQIARSFGARVIEVSRKGVGYATHVGFENAKGDIIIRTDADAIFPPELISDWEFGWRAKNSDAKIHFDLENFVLVSARRIKKTGLFRYILGFRKR